MKYLQNHDITGSINITGSVNVNGNLVATASMATSASYSETSTSSSYAETSTSSSYAETANIVPSLSQLTYLYTVKTSTQNIPSGLDTRVQNFTSAITSINAAGWDASTGIYTIQTDGIYSVTATLQYSSAADSIGVLYSAYLKKNATVVSMARYFKQSTENYTQDSLYLSAILQASAGDSFSLRAFHTAGAFRGIANSGNYFGIQQISKL